MHQQGYFTVCVYKIYAYVIHNSVKGTEDDEDSDEGELIVLPGEEEDTPPPPSPTPPPVADSEDLPPDEIRVLAREESRGSHASLGRVETDSTHDDGKFSSKITAGTSLGIHMRKITEEDPIVAASKKYRDIDSRIGVLEKTYAVLAIDSSLGILAAMLPQELSVRFSSRFFFKGSM